MSSIYTLQINNFRNILSANIEVSPGFNVFFGDNGSGKTSLLEAIYFLGMGKSFRTRLVNRIIHHDLGDFSIFAKFGCSSQLTPAGVQRYRTGEKSIRMNGESISSVIPIAQALPLQVMTTDSHRIFHEGPKLRRQYLDWATFHVKPSFLSAWQSFQRTLKQRNSALKSKQSSALALINAWNEDFVSLSAEIDVTRTEIIEQLRPIALELINEVLPNYGFTLTYQRGWGVDKALEELLESNIQRDMRLGYTYYGPQRADILLACDGIPAQDVLSQGQQKLVSYALYLSQGILLHKQTGKSPIYLIDDLPAELDPSKRHLITSILEKLKAQVFITGITKEDLCDAIGSSDVELFKVENGTIGQRAS